MAALRVGQVRGRRLQLGADLGGAALRQRPPLRRQADPHGAVAGPEVALPSAALRPANLKIMGSGQGSVSAAGIIAELPDLAREIDAGTFAVGAEPAPLAEVERAWSAPVPRGHRLVLVP